MIASGSIIVSIAWCIQSCEALTMEGADILRNSGVEWGDDSAAPAGPSSRPFEGVERFQLGQFEENKYSWTI